MNEYITKSLQILKAGGTILYPTDTVWGIGCDATNTSAVGKIYDIKKRVDSKSMLVLLYPIKQLEKYVEKPSKKAMEIIKNSLKPTTIIYTGAKNLAANLIAPDGSIGIRVPDNTFCIALLKEFKKPIVSTSANISGHPAPANYRSIDQRVIEAVDYVVACGREAENITPSRIIKLTKEGDIIIIRE